MLTRLQQAGLWHSRDKREIDIATAWSILSRLGLPSRYGGKSPDGSYQYVIVDPHNGDLLSFGTGATLETSICDATLKAYRLRRAQQSGSDLPLKHSENGSLHTKGEHHEVPNL